MARFNAAQIATLTVLGIIFWFIGALLLRTVGPMGAYEGSNRLILYAAIAIGTVPFVPLSRMLARLRTDQTAAGTAWVTASAMVCDSFALPYLPMLYRDDTTNAGAAILWGAAAAVFIGFAMNRDQATVTSSAFSTTSPSV
jgi:hypothetical protein